MTRRIRGYFGGDHAKAVEGWVEVAVSGSGMTETLTLEYLGTYKVSIPVRAVQQLAQDARARAAQSGGAVEVAGKTAGYYSDQRVLLQKGRTDLWFRWDNGFEMLSLEHAGKGQISIPYKPVAALLQAWRRNFI